MDTQCTGVACRHRNELHNLEIKLKQSAFVGKQLLEDKDDLHAKIEELRQEKHSLMIKLEAKTKSLESHSADVEIQGDKIDKLSSSNKQLQEENTKFIFKIKELLKEVNCLSKDQEKLILENSSQKREIKWQEEQLKRFQDQLNVSISENDNEELAKLQNEVVRCLTVNRDVEEELATVRKELDESKANEKRLECKIVELEEEVFAKDREVHSCSTKIKESQDKATELQEEIERLKFDGIDVNKRGNSVFSELDDRRLLVENGYLKLKSKYDEMSEKYKAKQFELLKTKYQMCSISESGSLKSDQDYIAELERALQTTKDELASMALRFKRELHSKPKIFVKEFREGKPRKSDEEINYVNGLLIKANDKINALEGEVESLRKQLQDNHDTLITWKRTLHKSETALEDAEREILKLNLRLETMQREKEGISLDASTMVEEKTRLSTAKQPRLENAEKSEQLDKKILVPKVETRENCVIRKAGEKPEIVYSKFYRNNLGVVITKGKSDRENQEKSNYFSSQRKIGGPKIKDQNCQQQ